MKMEVEARGLHLSMPERELLDTIWQGIGTRVYMEEAFWHHRIKGFSILLYS
jgi:hypothetical protein